MKACDLLEYRDGELYWKQLSIRGFQKAGKKAGTLNKGYMWVRSTLLDGPLNTPLHRLVWELHNGPIPHDYVVDHIDRNPLNNKIDNLRLATRSENAMNAKGKSNRKNGLPRNVAVDWSYGNITKYRAQVSVNGKWYRAGNIETIEEAAQIAASMRANLHKNFKVKES